MGSWVRGGSLRLHLTLHIQGFYKKKGRENNATNNFKSL